MQGCGPVRLMLIVWGSPRIKGYGSGCSWAGSRKSWAGSPMGVGESWTGSPMEPPEKGRRGHTFTQTERASVATIYLSDRMHWICDAYAKYMRIYNYKIPVSNGLLVDAYAKHMLSIYSGDTVTQPTLYKTNKYILSICSVYATHIHILYYNNLVYLFNVIINRKCIWSIYTLSII